jgi:hypothetical protein
MIPRRVFREFAGATGQKFKVQSELTEPALPGRGGERLGGPAAVSSYAALSPLANLDARRGELDQSLEQLGGPTSPSLDVPELFPDFVCFPIISSVEELDSVQEPTSPPGFIAAAGCRIHLPGGRAMWMRPGATGKVRIRGKSFSFIRRVHSSMKRCRG